MDQSRQILLMGSCFAEEIGAKLVADAFPCEVNPFGVLYNPLSIVQGLQCLRENGEFPAEELFQHGGLWHSWMHHSSFSAEDPQVCLEKINGRLNVARGAVPHLSLLLITLGSNRYYRLRQTGEVVGNCHKVPSREFEEVDLSVTEIVEALDMELSEWWSVNPTLKVMFTVSPIRYLKYGLHQSMVGKATLLTAVDVLQKKFPDRVLYFPAFEILLDDLRDYRFYAPDMVHPSSVAVDYIYERFQEAYFSPTAHEIASRWNEIQKALNHKPFHPDSEEYKRFRQKTQEKILQLEKDFPFLKLK